MIDADRNRRVASHMNALIVDDHPLFIKGVEALLAELEPSISTVGARHVEEALRTAAHFTPDLILLDLNLPGMHDLEALMHLRAAFSATPIVVVSANDSSEYIRKAIELGAAGYIPKDTEQALMTQALRLVLARGVYVPSHVLRAEPAPAGAAADHEAKPMLSDLKIAEGTVKAHLWSIYQALGVSSRLQTMMKAHELGLVEKFGSVE
jgi:DNA-binding NarL/FixJ family response regulator